MLAAALVIPVSSNATVNHTRNDVQVAPHQTTTVTTTVGTTSTSTAYTSTEYTSTTGMPPPSTTTSSSTTTESVQPVVPDDLEVGFGRTLTLTEFHFITPDPETYTSGNYTWTETDYDYFDEHQIGQYLEYTLLELPNEIGIGEVKIESNIGGDYYTDTGDNEWGSFVAFFVYTDWNGWGDVFEQEKKEMESAETSSSDSTYTSTLKIIDEDEVFGVKYTDEYDYGTETYGNTTFFRSTRSITEMIYDKDTGSIVKVALEWQESNYDGETEYVSVLMDKDFDFGSYDNGDYDDDDGGNILGLSGLTWFIAIPALFGIVLANRKRRQAS